jgi:MoaA/NifB/PqqE/SkfB family radical SAM enzyme
MLTLNDIVGLNLEVSSKCNARCPFCSRNDKVREYGNHLLTLANFKGLPEKLYDTLEWVSFAGNFGDPATNKELPEIVSHFQERCPDIILMADSNGSVQTTDWWNRLGQYFSHGVMCIALDGLEDTHAIHRKKTQFTKIIENVTAFTSSGGIAHWKFLLFKHNEHQVEEAARLAEEIGCARFYVVSSREYSDACERPVNADFQLKEEIFAAYGQQSLENNEEAICKPLQNHSIYIAADGTVHPCCLAHCNFVTEHEPSFRYIIPLIDEHLEKINFKTIPLEEILRSPYFNEVFEISKTNDYCVMKCNKYRKRAIKELILHDRYF